MIFQICKNVYFLDGERSFLHIWKIRGFHDDHHNHNDNHHYPHQHPRHYPHWHPHYYYVSEAPKGGSGGAIAPPIALLILSTYGNDKKWR